METQLKYLNHSVKAVITDAADHIQRCWAVGGFYETQRNGLLNHIYLNQTRNGKWFDIGASIGNHSLFFAMLGNTVHSFEPVRKSFEHLKRNVELNGFENVTTYNMALGDYIGRCSMKQVSDTNCGMNQVVAGDDVEMATIDSMECFEGYNMIKIDVEHFNRQLIKGATRTFSKGTGDIYIEAESESERIETDGLMSICGYKRVEGLVLNHTPTYLYRKA